VKLRVLVAVFTFGRGAGGSSARVELTKHLDAEVAYLVANRGVGWKAIFGSNPPTIIVNPVRDKPHVRPGEASIRRLVSRNRDLWRDVAWVRRQQRIADAHEADVVCSMNTLMKRADVFFVPFLRAQSVENSYGVRLSHKDRSLRWMDAAERYLLHIERTNLRPENHRLIVVPSFKTRAAIEDHYGLPATRIKVIHNAVDLSRFEKLGNVTKREAKAKLGMSGEDFVILFVGRSPARKGALELISAVAKLRHRRLKMVLAGFEDSPVVKRHIAAAGRHFAGLRQCIDLPGDLDTPTLEMYYGAADLFVLPSHIEPFGLVALEAMAHGIPAVVSDATGVSEVIEDTRTGFIVRTADLESDLERVIHAGIHGQLDLGGVGERGRNLVVRRLNWKNQAIRLQEELQEIASRRLLAG
jgi:glycosyltransferase involved in cell wall biosynthesis